MNESLKASSNFAGELGTRRTRRRVTEPPNTRQRHGGSMQLAEWIQRTGEWMFASAVGCRAERDLKREEVEFMWDLEEQRVGLVVFIHSQPTSSTQMMRGLEQSITHTHTHTLMQQRKKKNSSTLRYK